MMRTILVVLLAMTAAPTIGSGADAPPKKADTTRADVQAFVKAFVEATNKGDMTAVMEMYSRKPVVTSISDGEITRGWEAIRTESDQMVGKEGSYKFSIGAIDVTPLGTAFALAVAPYTVTVATDQGAVQVPGAMTLILERSGGAWAILHDHTSVKAGAATPQEE